MRGQSLCARAGGVRAICFSWALAVIVTSLCAFPNCARAQSLELAMRDFSSSQIKKVVRSIGFGGDGATWGNYGLVWRDANTALVDYGDTHYTNGNDFHFEAVGLTLPPLWHHLAIYAIAMFQGTNDVRFSIKSPGLGPSQVPVTGKGSDNALFSKIAMPLGKGFSVGGSISPWEGGWFDAGATRLERRNAVAATHTIFYHPNLGFEQTLLQGRLTPRVGLDETSPTAGLSYRFTPFRLDFAYVNNMAKSRVHDLFGQTSNSFLLTLTIDYGAKRPKSSAPSSK